MNRNKTDETGQLIVKATVIFTVQWSVTHPVISRHIEKQLALSHNHAKTTRNMLPILKGSRIQISDVVQIRSNLNYDDTNDAPDIY